MCVRYPVTKVRYVLYSFATQITRKKKCTGTGILQAGLEYFSETKMEERSKINQIMQNALDPCESESATLWTADREGTQQVETEELSR